MSRTAKLLGNFFRVGVWTLVSRILGFIRDVFFAAFLGAGPLAEAFLIAFTLPNMFRRIFAEGAFNLAFVPIFSKKLNDPQDARHFAENAFSVLISSLLVVIIIAQMIMPYMVLAMASGFAGDERFDMAVLLGRIAFPYVLFISAAALFSGLLNSLGRFVAAAAAPCLLNLLFILALVGADWYGLNHGLILTWAVPVAGMAQLALVWVASAKAGFNLQLRWPRFTPEIRKLVTLALPAVLTGGVVQVNLIIGRQVASFTEGAVAWLNYADRLYQLPLGVVGVAVGVVLLPELAKKLVQKDLVGGNFAFNRACEVALALTLPATAALLVIAQPIVSVLFERGAFTRADTLATSLALVVYALGLPAFVLQKVYQPVFFAREDTKTPFRYAVVSMLVNAAVALGLMKYVGFIAAAIGTTAASWAMLGLLVLKAYQIPGAVNLDSQLKSTAPKIVMATLCMGAGLVICAYFMDENLYQGGIRYLHFIVLIAMGLAIYGLVHLLLRTWQFQALRRYFEKQSNSTPDPD